MDESWTVKKAERRRIDAFELWCWRRLLRVPWTVRRSNQSILKISPGISLEGMMLKSETPVLWPPHVKSWLIGNDSDAGRDWRQEEKGMTEDEMAGWHHWLDGCESEWTLGVGDGQGGLACCDSWGGKESDTTEWLIWSEWLYRPVYISIRSDWSDLIYIIAAAAAKSLQLCPTLCDPRASSPPGSAIRGILQARTLEWVAISFSKAWKWKVKVRSLSHVQLFATPWTAAYPAPLSMGFSRQEYWSGWPLPSL